MLNPKFKVYVFLWPTKDDQHFVILYVRQDENKFTVIIHPDFTEKIPNSALAESIQAHVEMGLRRHGAQNCPGLIGFCPRSATRLDVAKAFEAVFKWADMPMQFAFRV